MQKKELYLKFCTRKSYALEEVTSKKCFALEKVNLSTGKSDAIRRIILRRSFT